MARGRDGEEILEPEEEAFNAKHASLFPEIPPRTEPAPCRLCGGEKLLWKKQKGSDNLLVFECPECRILEGD